MTQEKNAAAGSKGKRDKAISRVLMVQGTASDVGKSVLAAALCRIFAQDGWTVAPFKSQNMSLNSYVTPDGKEIGRAQGMQADACGIAATTDMNPILLKPSSDRTSQVVVHGKPYKTMDAFSYRSEYLTEAGQIVRTALERLRAKYEIVVLEGAGSPAEINLKDRDIVNMRMAAWADAPVLLAADIDRGGVFASIVGTLELLEPEERDRVKGFVINKFRGDVELLKPGLEWLERRTGKPVVGVIPYLPDLRLETEDSLSFRQPAGDAQARPDRLDIVVIRLPRWSNFTDIDPLLAEEDVSVRFAASREDFGFPDAVILPGSKNTAEDLLFLRETGLDRLILDHRSREGWLTGICGGYQMLGERLNDPEGIESAHASLPGLAVFPMETTFGPDKKTERVTGQAQGWSEDADAAARQTAHYDIEGYEIHMGRTFFTEPVSHPLLLASAESRAASPYSEGARSQDGRAWGTYVHGILHNDGFRRDWLNAIRRSKGWPPIAGELNYNRLREAEFDRLAGHVRRHLDIRKLYEMMNEGMEGSR
ncbi:cobyric acid synthase CobQ [Cohnella sp. CIP 111063]|uniref:cobyric acid synthase n=1 Tax=unclassified Cohnella TaxID=2636738 RepID=UPI000B8C24BE|nr:MULTISPECIES: cobyric acid synthase [unclassified Cohnella]OXS53043.1 cobyric acid synthase CobQ [Cohnella sp. CIP 111063]PRX60548.1 adenosylcobyric acid synthase (glutamine-hydrolysing) [Cohnella sp. SGD-V74]